MFFSNYVTFNFQATIVDNRDVCATPLLGNMEYNCSSSPSNTSGTIEACSDLYRTGLVVNDTQCSTASPLGKKYNCCHMFIRTFSTLLCEWPLRGMLR